MTFLRLRTVSAAAIVALVAVLGIAAPARATNLDERSLLLGQQTYYQTPVGNRRRLANRDGRLEDFWIASTSTAPASANGFVWHQYQLAGGGWSAVYKLGTLQGHDELCGTHNADGRLEIFIKGDASEAEHIYQTAPNSGWSSWSSLGGGMADGEGIWCTIFTAPPPAPRIGIAVYGPDANVHGKSQIQPNGSWTAAWY